jgi:hypothetical protein
MSGSHPPESPAPPDTAAGPPIADPEAAPAVLLRPLAKPRRLQNTVIAVALLAEFVALIGHPLFGWGDKFYAVTPPPLTYHPPLPPSGGEVLSRLAGQAARIPAPATGAYAYVKVQSWQIDTGRSDPPSPVVPVVTQSWRTPAGTGRMVTFIRAPGATNATARVSAPAGGSLPALSPNAATLAGQLAAAAPASDGAAREFVGFENLARRQPIPPAVEASILDLLARIPGVTNSGSVVDRDGRAGVAVSLDSGASGGPIRYTLIFAPSSGRLLESDQTLDGDPIPRGVKPGSVMAYTAFLATGYVSGPSETP